MTEEKMTVGRLLWVAKNHPGAVGIVLAATGIGAILGVFAYYYGWLG